MNIVFASLALAAGAPEGGCAVSAGRPGARRFRRFSSELLLLSAERDDR
jgi:hypothetical protein